MEMKNNFSSIIGLGSFNPAILSPTFLQNACKLEFKEKPHGQTTPVVSSLSYGNLQFIISLEKLEIRENGIEDFNKTIVARCLENYLDVLKYTPVLVCGINFNLTITDCDVNKIGAILKDNNSMKRILSTTEITIDKKEILKNDELSWQIYNFTYPSSDNTVCRINVARNENGITLNHNYEVRDVQKDINRMRIIGRQLKSILSEKDKII